MCIFTAAAMGTAAAATAANVSLGMSAATTAMGFIGQSQQASAQNAMMAQRQQLGTERALANYANQTRQARDRQLQMREAAANEINEVYRESRKRVSTAQVAGAEGGVAGASLQALINDMHRQNLEFGMTTRRNLEFQENNIEDQLEAVRIGTQGQIESLQFMPAAKPSFLGAALRIGAGAFSAYSQFNQNWGPAPGAGTSNAAAASNPLINSSNVPTASYSPSFNNPPSWMTGGN